MSLSIHKLAGLSHDDCFQIAIDGNKKIYYCDDDVNLVDESPQALQIISDLVDEAIFEKNMINLDTKKIIDIQNDIIDKELPTNKYSKKIYNDIKGVIDTLEFKYYVSDSGNIQVIPKQIPEQRECIYIGGRSGSGKSTWASDFALQYQIENPGNRVFIFSVKSYDKVMDGKIPNLVRIPLDKKFVIDHSSNESEILNRYSDSLIIYDDFQQIKDDTVLKTLDLLKGLMLEVGRSKNISVISIQHKLLGSKLSIKEFTESDTIVFFPKYDNGEIFSALRKLHFSFNTINNILDSDARKQRWLCLIRPNIVVTKNYIKIVDL
jgi:hypothetical protein